MLKVEGVSIDGEVGQLRSDSEQIGFKGSQGTVVVYPGAFLQVAEWLDGELRMLFQDDETSNIVTVKDFKASDYDRVWEHFKSYFSVYIKLRKQQLTIRAADFDAVLKKIEKGADRVDEAPSESVKKKSYEADLMTFVEVARDVLREAVSGDKQALSDVFSANGCERTGRLKLVIQTIQLEVYASDQRWRELTNLCASVEAVLREIGTYRPWKPSENDDSEEAQRQLVRQLRLQSFQEEAPVEDLPARAPPVPERSTAAPAFVIPAAPKKNAGYSVQGTSVPGGPLAFDPLTMKRPPQDVVAPQAVADSTDEEETPRKEQTPSKSAPSQPVKPAAPAKPATPGSVVRQGWLYKQSRHMKRWRRRWFIMTTESISSYKQQGDGIPTEAIYASEVRGVRDAVAETGMRLSFAIILTSKTFLLSADTENEKQEWMRELEEHYCRRTS